MNIKSDFADVLPQGVTSPLNQMAGWMPQSKNFEIMIPDDNDSKNNIEFTFASRSATTAIIRAMAVT